MTFNGQVPGPLIRVRQGDTITLTLPNDRHNTTWHSIDLHAVYGPGGGADPLTVLPGQSNSITFTTMYPGAFIYHCAVPGEMDMHIERGMFGMIVVEPEEGLPHVDREFYLGQNETYTKQMPGSPGPREIAVPQTIKIVDHAMTCALDPKPEKYAGDKLSNGLEVWSCAAA